MVSCVLASAKGQGKRIFEDCSPAPKGGKINSRKMLASAKGQGNKTYFLTLVASAKVRAVLFGALAANGKVREAFFLEINFLFLLV